MEFSQVRGLGARERRVCSLWHPRPFFLPLFTQVTLLWSSDAALSGDAGLVSWTCRRGTGVARDQHAVCLPGDVALQAADDLSLALALRGAPRYVFLCSTISPHPSQADHVQRTVGLSVAYIRLRRCLTTLPDEASMGAAPHRLAKEASLPNLWGLSPATIKSVAALSVPMPAKETNSGAACATSRSRCASSSTISLERAS